MSKKPNQSKYPDPERFATAPETLLASVAYSKSSLNEGSLSVYLGLDRHFDKRMDRPVAYPSLRTLGIKTGLGNETVSRHLRVLHEAGFIKRMYACRIHGRSLIDSLATIKPYTAYSEAAREAQKFKSKSKIGASVCLLLYKSESGKPTRDDLIKLGFLPKQTDELWGADHDPVEEAPSEYSGGVAKKKTSPLSNESQQNDNDVTIAE